MITPILKDPKKHGGTLYTFPSASRDLTRAFSYSEYEFAFSHFACLDLPDFRYGDFVDGDVKGIYLDNICKYYLKSKSNMMRTPNIESPDDDVWGSESEDEFERDPDSDSISDKASNYLNRILKWHLQSYVMNFEVAILNGFSLDSGKYDNEILRTPSERIFFNWLQRVGAIKFNKNKESLDGYGYGDAEYDYVLESESELGDKDKTKRYRIGNKLYVYKGGEWRSRILVSKTVQYIGTIDMINNVNIDYDSFNEIYLNIPAGVGGSTDVYFDNNVFDKNYERGEIINVEKDDYSINSKYIIGRDENSSVSDDETLMALYDSKYESDSGYESPTYVINNGYCINFNDSKYTGGSIENMNLASEEDFEFNCVLIYYKIRKGSGEWYTNLYGVLFLEEVSSSDNNDNLNEDDERAGYIQRYPKFKKGNSWGLKLDLKIDAQPDSQMELRDKLYDDPNAGGYGMQMFTEALMQLNECSKLFYDVKKENTDIEERLYKLENIVTGVDTVYALRDEVGMLRTKVEMMQPTINSLEGKFEDIDKRLTKVESNIGSLIAMLKK